MLRLSDRRKKRRHSHPQSRGPDRMRLLLINANTSAGVTDLCAQAARKIAASATEIVPLTGRFGARIIESRAESAIAIHAMLELVAENAATADAALVAVSYDTGLREARDLVGFPVVGITQASLAVATLIGSRVGMITFGTPWIYRELAQSYGAAERIAAIEVVQASAKEAYENPDTVSQLVRAAICKLVELGLKIAPAAPASAHSVASDATRIEEIAVHEIKALLDPALPVDERERRIRRLIDGPPEFSHERIDLPKHRA